jgi:hypothetical protein
MHSDPIRGLSVCPGFLHITTGVFVTTGAGFLVVAFGVGVLLAVGVGVTFGVIIEFAIFGIWTSSTVLSEKIPLIAL